jgi:enamine deaminase RidA (YjgF/YER057c/UK114 family)
LLQLTSFLQDPTQTEIICSQRQFIFAVCLQLQFTNFEDMSDYAGMNKVWDAWIGEGFAPARACVQALMANPSFRVEIMVVAAIPAAQ